MNEAQSGGGGVVGVMILPKDKDVVSAKYSSWNSDLILGPYCESYHYAPPTFHCSGPDSSYLNQSSLSS